MSGPIERLRAKTQEKRVETSILFTGFVSEPELDTLYSRAALFALPSRGEGFGLVYLEAMSHRLACVGSIHDAARDVVVDGRTGRLVDQSDRDALTESLVALLNDPAERQRMGDEGYRQLHEHFSFDRFADRFQALVQADRQALAS